MKITSPAFISGQEIGHRGQRGRALEIAGAEASGTIIRNCTIHGAVCIYGAGKTGQAPAVRESSKTAGHTARMREQAPAGVVIENCTIFGYGGFIPVYFAPGATGCTLRNTRIVGRTGSSVVYLDAEGGDHTLQNNCLDCFGPREVISIDGSADNKIIGNTIRKADFGGVYIYRNTGEGGAARHQEPRRNVISGNRFHYEKRLLHLSWRKYFPQISYPQPTIWLSYDSIWRTLFLSWRDRHIPFGSGLDNSDFARENVVTGNRFADRPWWIRAIKDAGKNNSVTGGNL